MGRGRRAPYSDWVTVRHVDRLRRCYHRTESRWGYRLLLGGTKHFGYYDRPGFACGLTRAMRRMEDRLGTALDLPAGSSVLDAGCGMGSVALRLSR